MRTTISSNDSNMVVLLGLLLIFTIVLIFAIALLPASSRYHLTLAEIQTRDKYYYDTNANVRYIFADKVNDVLNQNQTTSAEILNNGLRSSFFFEYSRSGGQINPIGKTISYNSTSNARQILFTDSNGSVIRQNITNPKDLNLLIHLKQLITDNQHLLGKDIDYTNSVCNDCLEYNLTVSTNKEPHFVTWYDESSTKVPGSIREIAGIIVNLCSCGKYFNK